MCRPLYEVPIDQESESASTPSSGAPVTIAPAVTPNSGAPTPSPAPGKVQKAGRRQSNLQAVPENIARALDSMSNVEQQKPENGSLDSMASLTSRDQVLPTTLESVSQHHQGANVDAAMEPQEKSCCSGKSKNVEVPPEKPEKQGSCCAKKESVSTKVESSEDGSANLTDGHPYSSTFATPSVPAWQNFHQPTDGGLFQNYAAIAPQAPMPMYFPPYAATQPTPDFSYQNTSHMGLNQPVMPVLAPNQQSHGFPYATNATCEGSSEHKCHCGDGCQCLGCASHPFNNTTKQHVQEMGLMVGLNGDGQNQQSPYPTHPATPLDYSIPGVHQNLNSGLHSNNNMHPYPGQYGDGYTSHASYQQDADFMEASQYYTLEYPVGLPNPCSDITGSCQCGNDCSCVGCLTHNGHNGFKLESPSAQTIDFHSKQSADPADHATPKDPSAPSPSL